MEILGGRGWPPFLFFWKIKRYTAFPDAVENTEEAQNGCAC
jgi:hypothetical protein